MRYIETRMRNMVENVMNNKGQLVGVFEEMSWRSLHISPWLMFGSM